MQLFEIGEILKSRQDTGERYLQFINAESLSLGVYVLPAGTTDLQTPHAEDEIYYVVSGNGVVEVAGEQQSVQSGSIIFVARDVDHRFMNIEQELSLLVFFAPQHAG